jgi:hypothetical protein
LFHFFSYPFFRVCFFRLSIICVSTHLFFFSELIGSWTLSLVRYSRN